MTLPRTFQLVRSNGLAFGLAAQLRRRPRGLAPRFTRAAADRPGIDLDDLVALLDRPRPAHGDIHVLLKRRSGYR